MKARTDWGSVLLLLLVGFCASMLLSNISGTVQAQATRAPQPSADTIRSVFAISTSDVATTEFPVASTPTKLYTGSGGTIRLELLSPEDTEVDFANVPAGQWWDIQYVRVETTGTSATGLKGGY